MKQRYFPGLIEASLLVSGSIITGLTNADMDEASQKRGKFMAKELDFNGDGSLDDKEIKKMKRHHYGKMKNKTGGYGN